MTNYSAIKAYADAIPEFDGNEFGLYPFIEQSTRLLNQFSSNEDENLNTYLLGLITGKFKGKALAFIGSRCDLTTWTQIKNALINCFDDHRSIDCLVNDINSATPLPRESLLEFSNRLQMLRGKIATKLKAIPIAEMPLATKEIRYAHYESMTLNTFIRNLHPFNLQMAIRLRDPTTLEQAQTFLIQEENFQRLNNTNPYKNNKPSHYTKNTHAPQHKSQPSYPPAYMQQFAPRQTPQPQQFYQQPHYFDQNNGHTPPQRPNFPSQPINIQPRPIYRTYPTNKQVFGKPQPVFGKNTPAARENAATNNPTPMSISKQISHKQNRNQFTNYTPQKKYTVEELYNTETDESLQGTPDLDTSYQYQDQYTSDSYYNGYDHPENPDPSEPYIENSIECANFQTEASENMN